MQPIILFADNDYAGASRAEDRRETTESRFARLFLKSFADMRARHGEKAEPLEPANN